MVQHIRKPRRVRWRGSGGQFDVLRARRAVELATDAHIAALHRVFEIAFDLAPGYRLDDRHGDGA